MPPTKQIINSLKKMLKAIRRYAWKVNSTDISVTTSPTIRPFEITAGKGANHIFFILEVIYAARKVARVPKIISKILLISIFDIKHPMVRPKTASGIIKGSTVKTSETLN